MLQTKPYNTVCLFPIRTLSTILSFLMLSLFDNKLRQFLWLPALGYSSPYFDASFSPHFSCWFVDISRAHWIIGWVGIPGRTLDWAMVHERCCFAIMASHCCLSNAQEPSSTCSTRNNLCLVHRKHKNITQTWTFESDDKFEYTGKVIMLLELLSLTSLYLLKHWTYLSIYI